jgi:hypothetical protein
LSDCRRRAAGAADAHRRTLDALAEVSVRTGQLIVLAAPSARSGDGRPPRVRRSAPATARCGRRTFHGTDRDEEDDVVEMRVTLDERGGAVLDLAGDGGGEIRDSVALDELEAAERVPALGSIVLHFDFYGRLARVEVTDSADSVLPSALLDAAGTAAVPRAGATADAVGRNVGQESTPRPASES